MQVDDDDDEAGTGAGSDSRSHAGRATGPRARSRAGSDRSAASASAASVGHHGRAGSTTLPPAVADALLPRRVASVETLWERQAFGEIRNVTSIAVHEARLLPPAAASAASVALSMLGGTSTVVSGAGGGFHAQAGDGGDDGADPDSASDPLSRGFGSVKRAAAASPSFALCVLLGMADGVVAFDVTTNELFDILMPKSIDKAWSQRQTVAGAAAAAGPEGTDVEGVTSSLVPAGTAPSSSIPATASRAGTADDGGETAEEACASSLASLAAGVPTSSAMLHAAWVAVPPSTASQARASGLPGIDSWALAKAERLRGSGTAASSSGVDGSAVLSGVDPLSPRTWEVPQLARRARAPASSAANRAARPAAPSVAAAATTLARQAGAQSRPQGAIEDSEELAVLLPPGDEADALLGIDPTTGRTLHPSESRRAAGSGGALDSAAAGGSGGEAERVPEDGGAARSIAALASSPTLNRRLLVGWHRFASIVEVQPGRSPGQVAWRISSSRSEFAHAIRWSAPPVAVFASAAQPTAVAVMASGIEAHDTASGVRVAAVPVNTVVTAVRCEESADILQASLTPSRLVTARLLAAGGERSLGPVAALAAADLPGSLTRGEALLEAAARWWTLCEALRLQHRSFAGEVGGAALTASSHSLGTVGTAPDAGAGAAAAAAAARRGSDRQRGSFSARTEAAIEAQAEALWPGAPPAPVVRRAAEWVRQSLNAPETVLVVCRQAIVAVTLQPPVMEVASLVTGHRPLFAPALRACEAAVWRARRVSAAARQRRCMVLDAWLAGADDAVSKMLRSIAQRSLDTDEAADAAKAGEELLELQRRQQREAEAGATGRSRRDLARRRESAQRGAQPAQPAPRSLGPYLEAVSAALVSSGPEERSWYAIGGGVRRSRVRELQAIIGYRRFDAGVFDEGLGHLLLAGERPKRILSLFPHLLPRGVVLRRWFPVRVGLVVEHVMGGAIHAVVRYLAVARRWLALRRARLYEGGRRNAVPDPWAEEDESDFRLLVEASSPMHGHGRPGHASAAPSSLVFGPVSGGAEADSAVASAEPPAAGAAGEGAADAEDAMPSGRRATVIDVTLLDAAEWSMGEAAWGAGSGGAVLLSGEAVGLSQSGGSGAAPASSRLGEHGGPAMRRRFCRVEDIDEGVLVDTCLAAACIAWEAQSMRHAGVAGSGGAVDIQSASALASANATESLREEFGDATPRPGPGDDFSDGGLEDDDDDDDDDDGGEGESDGESVFGLDGVEAAAADRGGFVDGDADLMGWELLQVPEADQESKAGETGAASGDGSSQRPRVPLGRGSGLGAAAQLGMAVTARSAALCKALREASKQGTTRAGGGRARGGRAGPGGERASGWRPDAMLPGARPGAGMPSRARGATAQSAAGAGIDRIASEAASSSAGEDVEAARRTLRLLLTSSNLCDTAETVLRLRHAGKWAEVLLLLTSRGRFDEAVSLLSLSLEARVAECRELQGRFEAALQEAAKAGAVQLSEGDALHGAEQSQGPALGPGGSAGGAATMRKRRAGLGGGAGGAGASSGVRDGDGGGQRRQGAQGAAVRTAAPRRTGAAVPSSASGAGRRLAQGDPDCPPLGPSAGAAEAAEAARLARLHWQASLRRVRRRLRLLLAFLSCLGRESQDLVLWTLRPLLLGALGPLGMSGALGVLRQRRPSTWLGQAADLRARSQRRADQRRAIRVASAAARTTFASEGPATIEGEPVAAAAAATATAAAAAAPATSWPSAAPRSDAAGTDAQANRASVEGVPAWVLDQDKQTWASLDAEAAADASVARKLPWWSGLGPDLGLGLGVAIPFAEHAPLDPDAVLAMFAALARAEKAPSASAAVQRATMAFLEFVVNDIGDPAQRFHLQLAELYMGCVLAQLRKRRPDCAPQAHGGDHAGRHRARAGRDPPDGAPGPAEGQLPPGAARASAEPGLLGSLRRRLLRLFEDSPSLPAASLLPRLPAGGVLLEERASLLRRLGRHEEALRIWVERLRDLEGALTYCDDVAVDAILSREGAPSSLWSKGRPALAAAAAAAAARLGLSDGPPPAAGPEGEPTRPVALSDIGVGGGSMPSAMRKAWLARAGSQAVRAALRLALHHRAGVSGAAAGQDSPVADGGFAVDAADADAVERAGQEQLTWQDLEQASQPAVVSAGNVLSSASRRHSVYATLLRVVVAASGWSSSQAGVAAPHPSAPGQALAGSAPPSTGSPAPGRAAASGAAAASATTPVRGRDHRPAAGSDGCPLVDGLRARLVSPEAGRPAHCSTPPCAGHGEAGDSSVSLRAATAALASRAGVLRASDTLAALPGACSVQSVLPLLRALSVSVGQDGRAARVERGFVARRAGATEALLHARLEETEEARVRLAEEQQALEEEEAAAAARAARQADEARAAKTALASRQAAAAGGRQSSRPVADVASESAAGLASGAGAASSEGRRAGAASGGLAATPSTWERLRQRRQRKAERGNVAGDA